MKDRLLVEALGHCSAESVWHLASSLLFGFAPADAIGRGNASGDASTLFWARMPNVQHDAAALALIADYLPSAAGNSVDRQMFCSSLDNTIRFVDPVVPDASSEWLLCESHVEFVASGFAVSRGFIWSRAGKLLALPRE